MGKKIKLKLEDLKVQSFVTEMNEHKKEEIEGGFTGNCGSAIGITCPDPDCDFQSIPLNECSWTLCDISCPH